MKPTRSKQDRDTFLRALMIWDGPEDRFKKRVIDEDFDGDSFVDRVFSSGPGGILRD